MKYVRFFLFAFSQIHALEARIATGAVIVVAALVTHQCRNRVNSHGEQIVGISLKKRQHRGIGFTDFGKKIRIADRAESSALLLA